MTSASETASAFGCSVSHISRVERGSAKPSRALVQFYEDNFSGDGLLSSLFEVVEHAAEQRRRRAGGRRARVVNAVDGDRSEFVDDTIPHGTAMQPGQIFMKTWRVRNAGSVAWSDRRLERQGPVTGPGLITSPAYVFVPPTRPGAVAEVTVVLQAPTYTCSSMAYFKMINEDGALCFPDDYQLGLDVLVRVVDQPRA